MKKRTDNIRPFLCLFDEFIGTFRAADFNFSASAGNSDFLSAGWAFEMAIGFAFIKICPKTYPPIFDSVPERHKLLIFCSAFSGVSGRVRKIAIP